MSVVADHPHLDPAHPEPTEPAEPAAPAERLRLRRPGSDTAIALGALSVVTFWTFGLGIVLGLAAIGTGVLASRSEDVEDSESKSLEALFGILAGTFGVAVGAVFLVVVAPHW